MSFPRYPSYTDSGVEWLGEKLRDHLLETKIFRAEGEMIVFEKDHLFRSPSMAALAVMGRTANGWIESKDKDGRTLDEVKRQAPV